MGLVSVAHTGWTSWDVPGCGGISGHVRRGTSECGPYWAGTSWDVPGCGDILGHVRLGTSECGPYWLDILGCPWLWGHLRTCKTWDW